MKAGCLHYLCVCEEAEYVKGARDPFCSSLFHVSSQEIISYSGFAVLTHQQSSVSCFVSVSHPSLSHTHTEHSLCSRWCSAAGCR